MRDQGSIQLGFHVAHAVFVDRIEIAREILAVDNMGLCCAPEYRTGHSRPQCVTSDVIAEKPGPGVGHLAFLD
jgi:hypothetical protein